MGVITRAFTSSDTTSIWTLLNEIKTWVETLRDKGGTARYWCGWSNARDLANGVNYSIRFSNVVQSVGGVAPVWSGDAFSLPVGRYRITAQMSFAGDNSNGYRTLFMHKNPSTTQIGSSAAPSGQVLRASQVAATSNNTTVQITALVAMSETDQLIVVARQNSGVTIGYAGTQQDSELMIERIGD